MIVSKATMCWLPSTCCTHVTMVINSKVPTFEALVTALLHVITFIGSRKGGAMGPQPHLNLRVLHRIFLQCQPISPTHLPPLLITFYVIQYAIVTYRLNVQKICSKVVMIYWSIILHHIPYFDRLKYICLSTLYWISWFCNCYTIRICSIIPALFSILFTRILQTCCIIPKIISA